MRSKTLITLGALFIATPLILLVWLNIPTSIQSFDETKESWVPTQAALLDRYKRPLHIRRINFSVRRLNWVAVDDISPALTQAMIAAEDRRFHSHSGVDWRAFGAVVRDGIMGRGVRGASTITMQLVSLLDSDLTRRGSHRSLGTKLRQMRAALSLERRWRKAEILEAYLNLLTFKGEHQGIAATAHRVLGKEPSGLNSAESLVLASLQPSPNASIERITRRACAIGTLRAIDTSCAQIKAAAIDIIDRLEEPLEQPAYAPHLAARHLKTPDEKLVTTLDRGIQIMVQSTLDRHLDQVDHLNVRDSAAIVIDNETGEIRAWVGSSGKLSKSPFVDGVIASRQAGSTLKPHLYGLAIERGYLTAASIIDDSPINLETTSGLYIPQNYDHDFKGPVSVRTSLGNSLNIPAIRTLVLTGVEPFRDRLNEVGYGGIKESGEFYGYALALGSAEVSLLEQATAYRVIANGGLASPVSLFPQKTAKKTKRVMSENAAFIISNILSDRSARTITFGQNTVLNTRFWSAVKTGTSKAMRDNWAVGFSSQYTVAVWAGNFEGDSMNGVSGVTGAAPAWAEIMSRLHSDMASHAPKQPATIRQQTVRFDPAIETPRSEWFIEGTEQEVIKLASNEDHGVAITSPANGTIIALDPDIPLKQQQILFAAKGSQDGYRVKLNGEILGSAGSRLNWLPTPGRHRVEIVANDGEVLDRSIYTVREVR